MTLGVDRADAKDLVLEFKILLCLFKGAADAVLAHGAFLGGMYSNLFA
jgi:hypothetical protein